MKAAIPGNRGHSLNVRVALECASRRLLFHRYFQRFLTTIPLAFIAMGNMCGAQAGRPQSSEDSDPVRGTVVNSVTRAAVAHALVFSIDNRFAKLTDDEGRFEFKVPRTEKPPGASTTGYFTNSGPGVPASRFTATGGSIIFLARKQGYFQSQTGDARTGDELGSSAPLRIEMVPEALIVGHVNLPVQDGTEKIQVQVYRRQVQEGRVQWVGAGYANTRANGEFRFASLEEGDYKLFTHELLDRDPVTFDPRGQLYGYPPVYFPAAGDFESAAVIHLKAGETFSATLTPTRREYYPVRLGVLNAPAGTGLNVEVEPQGRRGPGFSLGYNMNENSIQGMLPNGNYTVAVTEYGESGATGTASLSVNGAAVRGPTVTLAPNAVIEARVKDERTKGAGRIAPGARNLLSAMNVRLVPTEELGQGNFLWPQPAKNQDDEAVVFGTAHPGTYQVRAGCNDAGYVAGISSGGRDLLQQPLLVGLGAAVPPLEIAIRDDGAQANGSIEDWPRQPQNALGPQMLRTTSAVVLFLPLPDSTGQFCQAWVNLNGDFSLPQLAPGDYLVVAFEHMPENLEYANAEAIKKLQSKGQVLRLEAGQNEHLRVRLDGGNE